MFNMYPYMNLNDLNLDYILKTIKTLQHEVRNFVALNAIKYADPIEWNITKQYQKNTVVIDESTGIAYISTDAVPKGIAISNTDYWCVIFDLSEFITKGAANFANTYEAQPTTTATMPTAKDGWIVWNSTLYVALDDINAGDAYVSDEGGNIRRMTVEDFYNILLGLIKDNAEAIADEAQTRADEDARIELELSDLITSKIDVEAQTRADEDARIELELSNLIASQIGIVNGKIGDLDELSTTNKDNIVGAINELEEALSSATELNVINVITDIGCKNDGSEDCAQKINDYLAADTTGKPLLFPFGTYKFNTTVEISGRDTFILGQVFTNDDITLFRLSGVRMKFIFNKIGYSSTNNISSLDAGTSKGCAIEIKPVGDVCNAITIRGVYILADIGIKFSGYGAGFVQNVTVSDIYMLCRTACVYSELNTGKWISEIVFNGCGFNCFQDTDASELIHLHENTHGGLMTGWRFIGCAYENYNTAFNLEAAKVYLTNCRLSRYEAFSASTSKYLIATYSSVFNFDGNLEFSNVDQNFTLDSSVEAIATGYINNGGNIGESCKILNDGTNQFAFINQGAFARAFNHTFTANNQSISCGYGFDLSKGVEINVGSYTGCTVNVVYNNNYRPATNYDGGYYTGFRPFVVTVTGTASVTLATPNALGGGATHTLAGGSSYLITRNKTITL